MIDGFTSDQKRAFETIGRSIEWGIRANDRVRLGDLWLVNTVNDNDGWIC